MDEKQWNEFTEVVKKLDERLVDSPETFAPSYAAFVEASEGLEIPESKPRISYKYAEGQIIADFHAYIDKTYGQHYQTENNVQCFDAWIALDDATPTFRNTAIKYLWRYGKKNGNNKDDLMKVLHYTIMCLYNDHYKDGK